MSDTHEKQTVQTPGNAAGWAGVRFNPTETDPGDVTVTLKSTRKDHDYVLRGLKPYETVEIVVEAGSDRVERRAVALGAGLLYVEGLPQSAVKDSHDPALSVQVGDGGEITFRGQYVEPDDL